MALARERILLHLLSRIHAAAGSLRRPLRPHPIDSDQPLRGRPARAVAEGSIPSLAGGISLLIPGSSDSSVGLWVAGRRVDETSGGRRLLDLSRGAAERCWIETEVEARCRRWREPASSAAGFSGLQTERSEARRREGSLPEKKEKEEERRELGPQLGKAQGKAQGKAPGGQGRHREAREGAQGRDGGIGHFQARDAGLAEALMSA